MMPTGRIWLPDITLGCHSGAPFALLSLSAAVGLIGPYVVGRIVIPVASSGRWRCLPLLSRVSKEETSWGGLTGSILEDWEGLDGPDSGVGVDYWFRQRETGAEAYANLDQDHLTISVGGEKVYDGPHHQAE